MLPALSASSSSSSRTRRSATAITYPELLHQVQDARVGVRQHRAGLHRRGLLFILINYALTRLAGLVERRLYRRGGRPCSDGRRRGDPAGCRDRRWAAPTR